MLEHGGRLRRAAHRHGIAPGEWLDLSTGISPWSWLVENPMAIDASAWSRLPEDDDDLRDAARGYYRADTLPVAGSQAAIQCLPRLRRPGRVGVIAPSYAEHAHHWRAAEHEVIALAADACAPAVERLDVLVLVQPNNPDGQRFGRSTLLDWHAQLAARGGWLVVDEAFADADPAASLATESSRPGLIVLRSLGKFFGLAGARVGFMLSTEPLRQAMQEALGPWTLSGPSRAVASAALRDHAWQQRQRLRLASASTRLSAMMAEAGLQAHGGCVLFQWRRTMDAARLHEQLARRGILTRLYAPPSSLRLGLPGAESEWTRLRSALLESVDAEA